MEKEYKPGTPKTDRNKAIYQMRQDGATLEAIGRKFGIGKERVRQIYLREERLLLFQKYKKRNGTRFTLYSIDHELRILERFGDARYIGGDYYKGKLTEAQLQTISERIIFLEAYREIIGE